MQQRLESSCVGRVLLSIGILVVLGGVLTWNLPTSELSRKTQPAFQRFMLASGLDQTWSLFAPDPPTTELNLRARILYDDGAERTWEVPKGDPFLGAYWDYRWLKWGETISAGADAQQWLPTAAWIARQESDAGRRPRSVTLVRHLTPRPIGSAGGTPTSVDFYVHVIDDGVKVPAA